MTQQLASPRSVASSRTTGRKPGPSSFLWLVWRQHASLVIWSVAATVAFCTALLAVHASLATLPCWDALYQGVVPVPANQCAALAVEHSVLYTWAIRLLEGVVFAPVVVGALWGAPLVAREVERGTQDLAWGQGISARRWLFGKLAALGLLAVVLSVPVWLCARLVAGSMLRLAPDQLGQAFGWVPFATLSPLVVPYTLAALSLGVLASVLLRKMIPAIVVAGLVSVGLGVGTADLLRPHYLPPTTAYAPISRHVSGPSEAINALYLQTYGFAGPSGHKVTPPAGAYQCGSNDAACLATFGITQATAVYQPSDHEAAFQWIEAGLALVLAGSVSALALWRVRPR